MAGCSILTHPVTRTSKYPLTPAEDLHVAARGQSQVCYEKINSICKIGNAACAIGTSTAV